MKKLEGLQLLIAAVCITAGHASSPTKILRGQNAKPGEFPYQVSIRKFNRHWCGGCILDAIHILTAAHCFVSDDKVVDNPSALQVVTGTIYTEDLRRENVFGVSRVIANDYYTPHERNNVAWFADIAVLKLKEAIPLDPNLRWPISLPSSPTPAHTRVVTSGWGVSYFDREGPKSVTWLQKLTMTTISLAACQMALPYQVNVGQLCARNPRGQGICNGDSGGPLVDGNQLVGIVSWLIQCGDGRPQVFTSVYDYLDWIHWAMNLG